MYTERDSGGLQIFTPRQTSEMLGIPSSTLRRYVRTFEAFLSVSVTQRTRGRRFTARDIDVLRRARELLSTGRSFEETAALLQVVEGDPTNNEMALSLVPSISKALTEAVDSARGLHLEVKDLTLNQAAIAGELTQIREWLALPWYRRLFGRPPE